MERCSTVTTVTHQRWLTQPVQRRVLRLVLWPSEPMGCGNVSAKSSHSPSACAHLVSGRGAVCGAYQLMRRHKTWILLLVVIVLGSALWVLAQQPVLTPHDMLL